MKNKFQSRFALLLVVLESLVFFSCSPSPPKAPTTLQKVTLASPQSSLLGYTIYVAKAKGYFMEEGLDLKVLDKYPQGAACLQSMVNGEVDLSVSSETPFLHEVLRGAKIAAFAQTLFSFKHAVLVARKDRGISSPKDLVGKRIAVSLGTNGEYFLDSFRVTNQLPEQAFTKIDMSPLDMVEAISTGEVDAVATWNPFYCQAEEVLGDNGVTFTSDVHSVIFLMAARLSFIENQPETIERVLKGLLKSAAFIKGNKAEADQIASKAMGVDVGILQRTNKGYSFDITMDQSLIKILENEARWAIEKKMTTATTVPNFLEHIYTAGLQKVKPNANIIYTPPPKNIKLAVGLHPLSSLLFVAQGEGYFKKQGLQVELVPYGSGKSCLEAVYKGEAHLATAGDTPIMYGIMEDRNISIVATVEHSKENNGIVARKDRGISVPNDLKGKRIGVTLRTGGEFVLDSFLLYHGLTMDSCQIVDIRSKNMVEALMSGEVDAVSTWYPHAGTLLERLDGNGVLFLEKSIYTGSQSIVGKRDYVLSNVAAIKKVLSALLRASNFVDDNPDEAQKIVAKAIGMDMYQLKSIWEIYDFNLGLDQALILTLRDEGRWAVRNKLVPRKKIPDFTNYIYVDALKEIAPSTVTIVH